MSEDCRRRFASAFCGYIHTGPKPRRSLVAATLMLEEVAADGHDITDDGSIFNCGSCWKQAIDWFTTSKPLKHPALYVQSWDDRYNSADGYALHISSRTQ